KVWGECRGRRVFLRGDFRQCRQTFNTGAIEGHRVERFIERFMAEVISSFSTQSKHFLSDKVSQFTESVIREMTRQAMLYGAVNLAQGFPDCAAPAQIKEAARAAIDGDVNQYAITRGAKNLRNAVARQMGVWQGISVDPEKEI